MASPGELVRTVSSATGVPLPTIVAIDRRLVKAKLRTKGGRGFNAAQMTPLDAARLLTAVLAGPHASGAADVVERYSQTHVDKTRSSDKLLGSTDLDDLAALPGKHSFVDALTALITSTSSGSIAKVMIKSQNGWVPRIEIYAFARAVRGRIRIAGLPNGLTASVEYAAALDGIKTRRDAKIGRTRSGVADDREGDLEQSRRVTERTILSIAALLAQ